MSNRLMDKHTISESESKYSIVEIGGAQVSYNIPTTFFKDVLKEEVVFEEIEDNLYKLSQDFDLKFGRNITCLIGNKFNSIQNECVVKLASNGKYQFVRKYYENKYENENKSEYEWFLKLYDNNISGTELIFCVDLDEKEFILEIEYPDTYVSKKDDLPRNKIIFGAPGTGKSFTLEFYREKYKFDDFERVTFHPNYTYSQFVGTYKPVSVKKRRMSNNESNNISYEYIPGPFMRLLVKALNNPKQDYLLIIEEINRANVAAVFGDVFQLLDRNKDNESMFPIHTTEDIRNYLKKNLDKNLFDKRKKLEKNINKMSIPKNMFIWATMNSADQGVFPMDTAFKRRWDFEYIGIDDGQSHIENIKVKLSSGDVKWNDLRIAINNKLLKKYNLREDKLLGPFFLGTDIFYPLDENNFVKDNEKVIRAFQSKVLMYLYEDVVKHNPKKLFGEREGLTYSSICKIFEDEGENLFEKNFVSNYKDL